MSNLYFLLKLRVRTGQYGSGVVIFSEAENKIFGGRMRMVVIGYFCLMR